MRSLASATQTTSTIGSSSVVSTVGVPSSSLTMSENFQNPPSLGTPYVLQLSLPGVSNAASITGSVYNVSGVSTPAITSAWVIPSVPVTSYQPLINSAYLYQHSSTTLLSGVTGQNQISTSVAPYPGVFYWNVTGGTGTQSLSQPMPVTVIDQHTAAASSMSMASQYNTTSVASHMVPLYPSLSGRLVQVVPSQMPTQGHSLSLPYQEARQVYYYHQGTGTGQLGHYGQSYGSVSYTDCRASVPQPETVIDQKEVQPSSDIQPASTSGTNHSEPAQPITQSSFQVMETSLGLQPSSKAVCQPQLPQFSKSCRSGNIQILERHPPPELEDLSRAVQAPSSNNNLEPPPAASQEEQEKKTEDDTDVKLPNPPATYQTPIEDPDPPLLPFEISDIYQLLACTDPFGKEEEAGFEKTDFEENSLTLMDQEKLENRPESSGGFEGISTMVEDIHFPQLFNALNDLDQPEVPEMIKDHDTPIIDLTQEDEEPSVIEAPSPQARKHKHKASEPISGGPNAKMQPKSPEGLLGDDVPICNTTAIERDPVKRAKHSNSKHQKAASSRVSKSKSHGEEKVKKTRQNKSKRGEETQQPGDQIKAKEHPITPRMKRKKHPPELTADTFKRPRTSLGRHMLESVQVFHALGKKSDKNTGLSTSRAMQNSSNPNGPQQTSAVKQWLDNPSDRKGPEKMQVKPQDRDGSSEQECSSPSQYELPPPGKVKLIPLPFLTLDKPQPRPVPRRQHSLATRRPAGAPPAQPGSSNATQPPTVSSPRPAPASLTGPPRPSQPIPTKLTQPGSVNPTRPSVPQSAASGPVPDKTASCASIQQKPIPTAVTKVQPLPRPPTQYLIQDFANQRNPWRTPDILGPVVSTPITIEQRPEREAMKRKAQQEREHASKYTSWGKMRFFVEREREMEISDYYGYVG